MASLNKLITEKKDLSATETHVDNITVGIAPTAVSSYAEGRFVSNLPSKFFITNTQSVPVDAMADYVVEAGRIVSETAGSTPGASGIWYYRKWAKGLLEVWLWTSPKNGIYNSTTYGYKYTDTDDYHDKNQFGGNGANGNYYVRAPIFHSDKIVSAYPDKIKFIDKPKCYFLQGIIGYPYATEGDTGSGKNVNRHNYVTGSIVGWTQTSPGTEISYIRPTSYQAKGDYKYDTRVINAVGDTFIMYRGRWK